MIYADYAATAPVRAAVVELVDRVRLDAWGNPSARHHALGRAARGALDLARERVAAGLGARPDEIIFTATATEAINLAMLGVMTRLLGSRPRVAVVSTEHPAVLQAAAFIARCGGEVVTLPVGTNGMLAPHALDLIDTQTGLVCCMLVNNETGVRQALDQVVAKARRCGALVLSDATQAVGRLLVDRMASDVDLMVCSGHKIGAGPGAAALVMRRGLGLEPQIHGGGQERGLRSGTENVPAIAALGCATELAAAEAAAGAPTQAAATQVFEHDLRAGLPGVTMHGEGAPRATGIRFVGLPPPTPAGSSTWLGATVGVAASSGSSCASGSGKPSAVLAAMGVPEANSRQSVRISFGHDSSAADGAAAAAALIDAAKRLRDQH